MAAGDGTRALTDRVKQPLFAILEPHLSKARVLDLFAGSGAAGIEALSRGAAMAVFVEQDARAAHVIRTNVQRAGLHADAARVVRGDVVAYLRGPATGDGPFDVVFADPPYDRPHLLATALEILGEPGAPLAPGALVVAKHFWRDPPAHRIGLLASVRDRRFGETALRFYRLGTGQTEEAREA